MAHVCCAHGTASVVVALCEVAHALFFQFEHAPQNVGKVIRLRFLLHQCEEPLRFQTLHTPARPDSAVDRLLTHVCVPQVDVEVTRIAHLVCHESKRFGSPFSAKHAAGFASEAQAFELSDQKRESVQQGFTGHPIHHNAGVHYKKLFYYFNGADYQGQGLEVLGFDWLLRFGGGDNCRLRVAG